MARDITQLHPDLQAKVKELQKLCLSKGLKIGISECYRSVAEQDKLYSYGRTDKSRSKVTNAKGSTYSSMHQWYVAVDFYRNDGKGAYYDNDGFFTKVGKIGQSINLEWGGSWKSPVDKPHFQLSNWGSTTSRLKQLYGTPEKFKASWNNKTNNNSTKTEKKTITKPSSTWVKSLQTTLNKLGYKDSKGKVLKVDGIVGNSTLTACPTIKLGDKNAIVKLLQERLTYLGYDCKGTDGDYGANTKKALLKFKADFMTETNNSDVGQKTWSFLLGIK